MSHLGKALICALSLPTPMPLQAVRATWGPELGPRDSCLLALVCKPWERLLQLWAPALGPGASPMGQAKASVSHNCR